MNAFHQFVQQFSVYRYISQGSLIGNISVHHIITRPVMVHGAQNDDHIKRPVYQLLVSVSGGLARIDISGMRTDQSEDTAGQRRRVDPLKKVPDYFLNLFRTFGVPRSRQNRGPDLFTHKRSVLNMNFYDVPV